MPRLPSFVRASASSVVATALDYALFSLLVILGTLPAVATLLGCVLGGVVNFTLNRLWAFDSRGPLFTASLRYVIVSAASAVANAALVFVCTEALAWSAQPSWWFSRVLTFTVLTYPLFRNWVFRGNPAQ